jgi:hypothetical protein
LGRSYFPSELSALSSFSSSLFVVRSLIMYKITRLKVPWNVVGADLPPPPARVGFPVLICFRLLFFFCMCFLLFYPHYFEKE